MIGTKLNRDFIARDYDVFGGLDVDKTSIAVTFLNHEGLVKSMRIPYSSKNLINYTYRHFQGKKVVFAYEAGPTGYGLYDNLTALGYPCLVVSPSMVPTAPGRRVKTNRLDSRKIAESLKGDQLKSIHIPSAPYRHLRHLIQLRDTFVRRSTADKCRIKALLLFEGIPFPLSAPSNQWSVMVIDKLKKIPLDGALRFKLDALLSDLELARDEVLKTTREIRRFCLSDPELRRSIECLLSIPGIGWIVATHLLARIGNPSQLKNARQIGAFLGLTPREQSTGDEINRGPITRLGDSRLRSKLIQAAWYAARKDPELRDFYHRVYRRHHRSVAARKAIVAVARKLTTRIYAVLHEQRPYVIGCTSPLESKEIKCPRGRLDDFENLKTPECHLEVRP